MLIILQEKSEFNITFQSIQTFIKQIIIMVYSKYQQQIINDQCNNILINHFIFGYLTIKFIWIKYLIQVTFAIIHIWNLFISACLQITQLNLVKYLDLHPYKTMVYITPYFNTGISTQISKQFGFQSNQYAQILTSFFQLKPEIYIKLYTYTSNFYLIYNSIKKFKTYSQRFCS
ncbi:unnamed protein product [Paramecium pentaurelia]|uniref:Transmembrane protein n=1 Tax=Paramecium pentaurelia TaxID=43138 RepID=A0A8S1XJW0_9CILI|nr:unnamed protein product [Paramecium pentaurelia]